MDSTKFIELYDWWFSNPNVWFNPTDEDDLFISINWSDLLELQYLPEMIENSKLDLTYILVHDQIVRHHVRVLIKNNILNKIELKQIINKHLQMILPFSIQFYKKNYKILNPNEFCFTLLPLRHSNIYDHYIFVLDEVWNKIISYVEWEEQDEKFDKSDFAIYKRFLKATYERFDITKANLLEYTITPKNDLSNIHIHMEKFINRFRHILDSKCLEYTSNNIYFNIVDPIVMACNQIKYIKDEFKPIQIVLSISGGIDSMILSWILKKLDFDIVFVHINYANREYCNDEKEMLILWAKYLNVTLFIRDITEISRSKCMLKDVDMRDLYENYTKNVRFNSYIQASNLAGYTNPLIVLGHNYDDCLENILTNIANMNKYENLNGMEFLMSIPFNPTKQIDSVKQLHFCRPILNISKKQIYEYALSNLIPFLVDSTPKWSQRGKIRDIVRPCLETWDPKIIKGLSSLTSILTESLDCVDILVNTWISRLENKLEEIDIGRAMKLQIIHLKYKFIKLSLNELICSNIFWNRFIKMIGYTISNKSLKTLIYRFELFKTKQFFEKQINESITVEISIECKMIFWKTITDKIIILFIKKN
jgi:tRNA(Ile)-lysidine synthase TilS/MesJ